MASPAALLRRMADLVVGPRSASEREQRGTLTDTETSDREAMDQYQSDLQLMYLLGIDVDFAPADIRNLRVRARWGDGRWLAALYDEIPRLGPGPQIRKMLEAIRDTEDQYKTTPEDLDAAKLTGPERSAAEDARDYIEAAVSPWAAEIKYHMERGELYGWAGGEIRTEPRGLKWRGGWRERIVEFRPIPERRFRLDPTSHEWLLCLSPLSMEGVPIAPLVARGKLLWYEVGRDLEPLDQRGLFFQLLRPWVILQHTLRWRAKRVERYGVPPVIGKVDLTDAKQKGQMKAAIENFGASLHMVVSNKSEVQLAQAIGQGRMDPQADFIEWCFREFDLVLLGDTQVSGVQVGAGSRTSKKEAREEFRDRTNARVSRLDDNVMNRQLIPGLVLRNCGEDVVRNHCPQMESRVSEAEDASALADVALKLSQAGFGNLIDAEDLIRRCTLQIDEDAGEEGAEGLTPQIQRSQSEKPSAVPLGEDSPDSTLALKGKGAKVIKLLPAGGKGGRFATLADFQPSAAEPAVKPKRPRVRLVSYGHGNGPLDEPTDGVLDARGLGYGEAEGYGGYVDPARTGRDPAVQALIKAGEKAGPTYGGLKAAAVRAIKAGTEAGKEDLTLGVACDHGRHRSVYVAERLGHELRAAGHDVTVTHRDADRWPLHGTEMGAASPNFPAAGPKAKAAKAEIAARLRAHLKHLHDRALEEGERALGSGASGQ